MFRPTPTHLLRGPCYLSPKTGWGHTKFFGSEMSARHTPLLSLTLLPHFVPPYFQKHPQLPYLLQLSATTFGWADHVRSPKGFKNPKRTKLDAHWWPALPSLDHVTFANILSHQRRTPSIDIFWLHMSSTDQAWASASRALRAFCRRK